MGDKTKIEWTDATWNPVRGCTKISQGCKNCYAEAFAERWRGIPGHAYERGFDLRLAPEMLDQPRRWTKPRVIFVNSMSDLFHKDVPLEYIQRVFQVMVETPRHTYQVLTKRADRLAELAPSLPWPANVWAGVSVEHAATAARVDHLRTVPAAVRFLSCEPLVGAAPGLNLDGIHWVIVGGESGKHARPMHPDWARDLRDQTKAAGAAFFFKQWGEWVPIPAEQWRDRAWTGSTQGPYGVVWPSGLYGSGLIGQVDPAVERVQAIHRIGKREAGRLLDGRTWDEMPAGWAPAANQ